jgi:hypothetical protein
MIGANLLLDKWLDKWRHTRTGISAVPVIFSACITVPVADAAKYKNLYLRSKRWKN